MLPRWMDLSTWEDLWTAFLITALFTIPTIMMSHIKHQRKIKDLLDVNTPGGIADLVKENNEPPESKTSKRANRTEN
jgi:hypothetical protein